MCFHERIFEATVFPASKRIKDWPLIFSWAAAASHTGPAPIIATGSDFVVSIIKVVSTIKTEEL